MLQRLLIAWGLLLSARCFSGHTLIATASTNGVIVLWDHSKVRAGHNTAATGGLRNTLALALAVGFQESAACFFQLYFVFVVNTFKEHSRATNRICWHNTDPALLLSGSQDGLIKIWVRVCD